MRTLLVCRQSEDGSKNRLHPTPCPHTLNPKCTRSELTVGLGRLPPGAHTVEIEVVSPHETEVGGEQPEVLAVATVSFEVLDT